MTDDPIMAALAEVETDDDADPPPGAGRDEPDPDEELELDEPSSDDGDDEESGFSVLSWAERVPEGSHLQFDAREWWDPETGGEQRLAFHLADAAGDGAGYPNGIGVLVAIAEIYWAEVIGVEADGDDADDDQEASDEPQETLSREEAEALV